VLLDSRAEEIIKKTIEMALEGDHVALQLLFKQIVGPRRERGVELDLPPITTAQDGAKALAAVVATAAVGQLSPGEAAALTDVIRTTIAVIETAELERRLEALEKGGPDTAAGGQR
jgi:hypothetical protein